MLRIHFLQQLHALSDPAVEARNGGERKQKPGSKTEERNRSARMRTSLSRQLPKLRGT